METNIILCESGCGIFDLHLSFISLRFKWKLKENNKRSITELALILFMRALARIAETTTVTDPPPGQTPPGQTPPWADTPPPKTGDGHCSGLYASYWNAFLLLLFWDEHLVSVCAVKVLSADIQFFNVAGITLRCNNEKSSPLSSPIV